MAKVGKPGKEAPAEEYCWRPRVSSGGTAKAVRAPNVRLRNSLSLVIKLHKVNIGGVG